MVSKTGEAETITSHYLFALGVYRTLYLFNWIWRYHFEGFFDLIAIVAGLVQTVLYCDFFYLYITKGNQDAGLLSLALCSLGPGSIFSQLSLEGWGYHLLFRSQILHPQGSAFDPQALFLQVQIRQSRDS